MEIDIQSDIVLLQKSVQGITDQLEELMGLLPYEEKLMYTSQILAQILQISPDSIKEDVIYCEQHLEEHVFPFLERINEEQYIHKVSDATIGKHMRHTIDFFMMMLQGQKTGMINYNARNNENIFPDDYVQQRKNIEQDPQEAKNVLQTILKQLQSIDPTRIVVMKGSVNDAGTNDKTISSIGTELRSSIEHMIHHMASIYGIVTENMKSPDNIKITDKIMKNKATVKN